MLPGFVDRVSMGMATLSPSGMRVKIVAPLGRKHSAWRGGSNLAVLPTFEQMLLTKPEYEESLRIAESRGWR